jgi:predicted enzyme related to lactoylglutathione lyase
MAARPEGTPCWLDATFNDLEGAKSFYGEVLGWTFGEGSEEYGNYTQAFKDGKAVAAIAPPMPGTEQPSAWMLYLASPDATAAAAKVREAGGTVLMEPMQVGPFGSMAIAQDPAGVTFGIWQAGDHEGFQLEASVGSFGWAEVFTRDTAAANSFFPKVFPYKVQRMLDEKVDYSVYSLGDAPVLGSMEMTSEVPAEVPSFISVYFIVEDCDAAVARVAKAGGKLVYGPMTTPFGRFASFVDPQGAAFTLIDPAAAEGEKPNMADAS